MNTLNAQEDFIKSMALIKDRAEQGLCTMQEASEDFENLLKALDKQYTLYRNNQEALERGNNMGALRFKPQDVVAAAKRAQMNNPLRTDYNPDAALASIKAMEIFRDKEEQKITSNYQAYREFDGLPHQRYDLRAKEGRKIYMPKQCSYGRVILSGTGYNAGLGNYAVISLGRYGEQGTMLLCHLSQVPKAGQELGKDSVIGLTGNTGKSQAPHLDIQFWNAKNNRTLTAAEFLEQLNNPDEPEAQISSPKPKQVKASSYYDNSRRY